VTKWLLRAHRTDFSVFTRLEDCFVRIWTKLTVLCLHSFPTMTPAVKVVTNAKIVKSKFSYPYSCPYRYMFTFSDRKFVNRAGNLLGFLASSKSFCFWLPQSFTVIFGWWRVGGVNSQKLFWNRKFSIYDFFDFRFYDCHYLDCCCHMTTLL